MFALKFFAHPQLGVRDGRLAECPETPNCVSSQSADARKKMQPIPWSGSSQAALDKLVEIVDEMPRAVVVSRQKNYLHAEFTSSLFRFVDDVEFLVDPDQQLIHFRSASRCGYSDLGANRSRMTEIAKRFASGR